MARCIQPACDSEIDSSYAFCPWCGADNRPPGQRSEIGYCDHEYIRRRYYCVRCGEARGWQRGPRIIVGACLALAALGYGAAAVTLGTGADLEQSWPRIAATLNRPLLVAFGWTDPGRVSLTITSSVICILCSGLAAMVLVKRPMGAYMEDVKSWRAPWRPPENAEPSFWHDNDD